MAANQATLEKYEELIRALQTFNQEIIQSAENMSNGAKKCMDVMGSDELSRNSADKVQAAVSKYRNVTLKSTELQKKLAREMENIRKIIDDSKKMGVD